MLLRFGHVLLKVAKLLFKGLQQLANGLLALGVKLLGSFFHNLVGSGLELGHHPFVVLPLLLSRRLFGIRGLFGSLPLRGSWASS